MSVWNDLTNEIENFYTNIRDLPVVSPVAPAEVRTELESRYSFREPVQLEALTKDVMRLLRTWNVHVTHPRYFGLFNPSVRQASIMADAMAALYNPQLAVWSHAPAAQEIERLTLRHFSAALGFPPDTVSANFTSGGAEANFSGVLTAIAHHFPLSASQGLIGLPKRPVIYVTDESHHSFAKSARMAGLGTDAISPIPTTDRFVFDLDALKRQIVVDQENGKYPLMIVGTAGTTSAGMVDPLPELADIAAACGAWFHADAAWGASAVLSPRLKATLTGIERADSVTWDAHKWLSVPMGAGMFFCRHPETVKRAFAISTSYMPQASGDGTTDPYATTVQWSRRVIGLKVFMALAELGQDGYGELIEHQARMGDLLRSKLRHAGWILVNDTPLPVVCFTHPDITANRLSTGAVLQTVYERGRVWISDVVLGGRVRALRACITSFRTDEADLDCLLDELDHTRRK